MKVTTADCVRIVVIQVLLLLLLGWPTAALSQPPARSSASFEDLLQPSAETQTKVDELIDEILEPEIAMEVDVRKSKLVRTRRPVSRFSITNPEIVEIVQLTPTEFEIIGNSPGQSTLTLWFDDQTLRYLIRVIRETTADQTAIEFGNLERRINELFPNSMVQLIPVADKLIVRGQARDGKEAAEILALIGGEAIDQTGQQIATGFINLGPAARPSLGAEDLPATDIISLLEVPGEQQVLLKVRIAELTRTALRQIGADLSVVSGEFSFSSFLGMEGAVSAILETDEVALALEAISSNGYSKLLAEPNLVTLNGRPASFIAGGEFAVPVVVGVDGAAAATTNFRGFGTQLTFTPTIIDKDRIRLFVIPSFSSINDDNTVDGIPGLDTRAVTTTVELREGQWLAIGGLLQDQQSGTKARVPFLGDIPILDTIFSRKRVSREETELLILVSPELVHPLEPKEAPLLLPGMEVTEPGNWDFFFGGLYEGRPHRDHRSTVWPIHHANIIHARHDALRAARMQPQYLQSESHYIHGTHGFSN